MKLNGFLSGSDGSENNYFALRLSFCLPESLNFLEALQCKLRFSEVVFSIFSRRVEISV